MDELAVGHPFKLELVARARFLKLSEDAFKLLIYHRALLSEDTVTKLK